MPVFISLLLNVLSFYFWEKTIRKSQSFVDKIYKQIVILLHCLMHVATQLLGRKVQSNGGLSLATLFRIY